MAASTWDGGPVVVDVRPQRAAFRPGEPWRVVVELRCDAPVTVALQVEAGRPGAPTVSAQVQVVLPAGRSEVPVELPAPAETGGRRITAVIRPPDDAGSEVARGHGAGDTLSDWRDDPRYGFLCDFAPTGDPAAGGGPAGTVRTMARFHLTCVQLYDWAWRHHELLAPQEPYTDVLGKEMSLARVVAAVDALHAEGMAALGYATLYAAERDFLDTHPGWGLLDDDGRPWHLADLFFLMDVEPGSAWNEHLLGVLAAALDAVDLDGFHLDQYGYPRTARTPDGRRVDVAAGLAAVVGQVAELVGARRPHGGSIFNNVNAWPLEAMAGTADVATYIEVWRPHTDYHHLVDLVRRARRSEPDRPVILAAYPGLLRVTGDADLAVGGLGLLAAVTLAAGGYPLLVGEGARVLTGGYYPEHVAPPPAALDLLTEVLDAGVAWRDFLRGPDVEPVANAFVDGQDGELALDLPWSSEPLPSRVWLALAERPGWLVVSLVNLLDADSARWNAPQPRPAPRTVRLRLPQGVNREQVWWSGTDTGWQQAPAQTGTDGAGAFVDVPVGLWSLVVARSG